MTGKEVREILLAKGIVLSDLANDLGITAQTLNSRLNAKHFKDEYLKEISYLTSVEFEKKNDLDIKSLMRLIESQQKIIESQQRTIENLSKK